MEIRRKVFSLLQDENGEERYYSTNEFEISYDEETGEKMFSEKEDKGMSTGAKIAIGAGGTAAVGVGALEAGYHGSRAIGNKAIDKLDKVKEDSNELLKKYGKGEISYEEYQKAMDKLDKKVDKLNNVLDKATKAEEKLKFVGKAEDAVAGAAKGAKEGAKKAINATVDAAHKVGESAGNGLVWAKDKAGNLVKKSVEAVEKEANAARETAARVIRKTGSKMMRVR